MVATRRRDGAAHTDRVAPLGPAPLEAAPPHAAGPKAGPAGKETLAARLETWRAYARQQPGGDVQRQTYSGIPVHGLYTSADLDGVDELDQIGLPGEYPYTRGIHHTGYRGKPWTMRIFAGFGTAEDTNARFKYLLSHGETGLSVAFDLPTLYGYDTDDPLVAGEFGKCGVAVSSLADMEALFDGIPVDQVTTSMTINGPAAVLWAMYIAAAEKRGISSERLGGTIQNDILKEFIAQKEWLFPPQPHLRLVVDTIEFGTRYLPRWNTVSISGYHIREAGATALQELAFTLADGKAYVEAALERGLEVDAFAPRLSFFFNAHSNFFEEIAKYRAARRVWARELHDRYGARNPRSLWLRFHTQTSGVTCTAQQPENNVVRVALQALSAVLGGTQSLHTNSLDEALALPSERAVQIALRTQQILLHETGATDTVDPLGGSYFVEWLTDRLAQGCDDYFGQIEHLGGVVAAIEGGFFQREIAESAYRFQQAVEERRQVIVGVNEYATEAPPDVPLLRVDAAGEARQVERLRRVRRERSAAGVSRTLSALERGARGTDNLMPLILDAVKAYATLGEICDVLRGVFGEYHETPAL